MDDETYRWRLIDDFVKSFNDHRIKQFVASDLICVDESMSRWYGQGGSWINMGLPMYVAIDRKPDSGCEIQTACCGKSGVMLQLRVVKSARREAASLEADEMDGDTGGLLHGTNVLVRMIRTGQTHNVLFVLTRTLLRFRQQKFFWEWESVSSVSSRQRRNGSQ
jgi:hypothetical protein